MTQIDLRYVTGRTNKSGKTLYYWHRRGFPLVRLTGDLQSLELAEQATKLNLAADGGDIKPKGATPQDAEPARKNSIGWLIEDYLASNTFASKAERTRDDYATTSARSKRSSATPRSAIWGRRRAACSSIGSSTASRTSRVRATTSAPSSR